MVLTSLLNENFKLGSSSSSYSFDRPPLGRDDSNPGSTYTMTSNGDVEEGGIIQFVIRRSGGLFYSGEVNFQVKSGSAKKEIDFIDGPNSGYQTISFPAAEDGSENLFQEIVYDVDTIQDDRVEMDESLFALLRPSFANDRISGSIAQAKIIDDDVISRYSLSATKSQVLESESFELIIERSSALKPETINLSLKSSGAEIGVDFEDIGDVALDFPEGTSRVTYNLQTIDDSEVEIKEGLFARIESDNKNQQVVTGIKYLEIKDNDDPSIYSLETIDPVTEGEDIVFKVKRTGGVDREGKFYFWTRKGTAKYNDFTEFKSQSYIMPADDDELTISVPSVDDTLVEAEEALYGFIKPFYKSDRSDRSTRRAKIKDNDVPVSYSLNVLDSESQASTSFNEGETITFEIMRSKVGEPGSVRLSLRSASARTKKDLEVPKDKTAVFAEDQDRVVFEVPIIDDLLVETEEQFMASLKLDDRADVISSKRKKISIVDNDTFTTYKLSVDSEDVDEGGTATFKITRSGTNMDSPGKVYFRTHLSSAKDEEDFLGKDKQTIDFAPGEDEVEIQVDTIQDFVIERDELFSASIRAFDKSDKIKNRQQYVSIVDDDRPAEFQLSADSLSVVEGDPFSITIGRSGGSGRTSSALLWTSNGSAKGDEHFDRVRSLQVDFLPDESGDKSFTIDTFDDDADGQTREFYLSIKPLNPYDSVESSRLKLSITDPIVDSGAEVVST